MNIWIITHNAAPPQFQNHMRNLGIAKYMVKTGHKVTIFGASTVPNTDINLVKGRNKFIINEYDGYKLVNIKSPSYKGNGISRRLNFICYPYRLWKYTHSFTKKHGDSPDVIINDLNVLAMWFPFWIAQRNKAPIATEVRDLWPESLVAYGYLKGESLLGRFLYRMEKGMYKRSDVVVFSMEGGYDYIAEKGLTGVVPKEKVYFINNGVDLEQFNENKKQYTIVDEDLDNTDVFKVVYTGSIRQVNNLGLLLDAAKEITNPRVVILIWGDGGDVEKIKKRISDENIQNVIYKGSVEKKYVPYIVSKADLNIAHNSPSPIFRFGISFNKLYDYFAAGKPVLCDFPCPYNPAINYKAGMDVSDPTPENIAKAIEAFCDMPEAEYDEFCRNSLYAATQYDFKELAKKTIRMIEEIKSKSP